MNLTKTVVKNHDELWPNYKSKSTETDPELIEVFDNFAFDDVISYGNLDTKTRVMMILGSTIASQALRDTQLLPYIGYPLSLNAIRCLNEVLPD